MLTCFTQFFHIHIYGERERETVAMITNVPDRPFCQKPLNLHKYYEKGFWATWFFYGKLLQTYASLDDAESDCLTNWFYIK